MTCRPGQHDWHRIDHSGLRCIGTYRCAECDEQRVMTDEELLRADEPEDIVELAMWRHGFFSAAAAAELLARGYGDSFVVAEYHWGPYVPQLNRRFFRPPVVGLAVEDIRANQIGRIHL